MALPLVAIPAAGGFSQVMGALNTADPNLLKPTGEFGFSAAGIASAVGFVAIGFAFLGSPQLLTRFMAARDQTEIVNGGFWTVLCVIGFDVGAVFAGMAGRVLYSGLADPETILPQMSAELCVLHRDLPGGGAGSHHVHRGLAAHPGIVILGA